MEELLQAEITDETDTWEETGSRRGPRREERGVGMSLFEHKVTEDRHVSLLTAPAARLWRHVRARCAIMQLTPGYRKFRGLAQIVRDRALSPQEIQAVGSFLSDSVAEFAGLASSDVALKVRHVCVWNYNSMKACIECVITPRCKA